MSKAPLSAYEIFDNASPNQVSSRVIVIANQKGGVGKTTTAINISTALAACRKRVLLIDLDPQGNASTGLGLSPHIKRNGSYHVILGLKPLNLATRPTRIPNLDILPASPDLAGVEIELVSLAGREYKLKEALRAAHNQYDYVIIDCPPSLGLITVNALAAANQILIPLQCEFYALEGLTQLLETHRRIRQHINPNLEILGIVLTMFDPRSALSVQVAREVRSHFGGQVFRQEIPRNVRISEAPSHGIPALVYDIRCVGSQAYLKVASEMIQRNEETLS